MAGGGETRSGLGWAILVIALAVPGVLFYNWWSHLKADREKAVAAKARGRVPEGGVFQSSPNSKLVNPMTPDASTAAVAAAVSTMSAAASVTIATTPAAAVADAPPAAQEQELSRDPMLSPYDLFLINSELEARRRAMEELAAMRAGRKAVRRRAPPIDPRTLVQVQGIVSNIDGGGNKAIVNNEVVGAGQYVGKVKIVKITDLGVTFEYQGRIFSKTVSKD